MIMITRSSERFYAILVYMLHYEQVAYIYIRYIYIYMHVLKYIYIYDVWDRCNMGCIVDEQVASRQTMSSRRLYMGNVAVYIRIYSMVTIHASSCTRISHENVCIVLGFVKQKSFPYGFIRTFSVCGMEKY